MSDPIRLRTRVYRPYRGKTILDFLCDRFRYHPREIWVQRLATGSIRVNGAVAVPDLTVQPDDMVEYEIDIIEPDVDFSYEVLYEDSDLIAVSKSGNIPVHASGNYIRHTLIARVRADLGEKVHLCHRLDRETSGIVLIARSLDARRAMSRAFELGQVEKRYLAIVRREPANDTFVIDRPLRKIGKQHPIPRTVVDARAGKPAVTHFRVLERLDGRSVIARPGDVSVVEASPETGRTNQVRVHLEVAGHPLVGDKTYGLPARLLRKMVADPDDPEVCAHLILPRHALHHARMRFAHPTTGETVVVESDMPEDLERFISARR